MFILIVFERKNTYNLQHIKIKKPTFVGNIRLFVYFCGKFNKDMRQLLLTICCFLTLQMTATPVDNLLERIDKGASKKFKVEVMKNKEDDFNRDHGNRGPGDRDRCSDGHGRDRNGSDDSSGCPGYDHSESRS